MRIKTYRTMLQIEIRQAKPEDARMITNMIKNMVLEMVRYGGHPVNDSAAIWSSMEDLVKANISRPEYLYLIARNRTAEYRVVGMAAANIEPLEYIFRAKPRLHLSAIYSVPDSRRQGVAKQLIWNVFEWGQRMNVVEADLNVLIANPARQFYEKLGFEIHQVSMIKKFCGEEIGEV